MKLDIRNKAKKTSFANLWFIDSFRKLRMVYTPEQISDADLKQYLINKYRKRYLAKGRFYSNVLRKNELMTIEEFIDKFLNDDDVILSGYGCLFKSQDIQTSMALTAVKTLLARRKTNKKTMLSYEEGSYWYVLYNTIQLAYKRSANSYYGTSGMGSSVFYNPHIQNSCTLTGRDLITTSISTMESYLSNSNKFNNLNELFEFINNVKYEKQEHKMLDYVDTIVSNNQLNNYLYTRFSFELSNNDKLIINSIVNNLNDEIRTRVFYKNQILKLFENTYFLNKIKEFEISKVYETSDEYGDPHAEIEFRKLVSEFTLYAHIYHDRYSRAMDNTRDSVLVVDTDLRIGSAI